MKEINYVSDYPKLNEVKDTKKIRFIDSQYKTLFELNDGAELTVIHSDGTIVTKPCKYLDECHFNFGNYCYHYCQFAEIMERNGSVYQPARK